MNVERVAYHGRKGVRGDVNIFRERKLGEESIESQVTPTGATNR